MKQNQGNKQKNIPSKPLRKIMVMIIAMVFVFTACHKKKKPFLLLPLIDNSSIASTDSGSGDGGSGSGVGSSGDGGSGGPTFTPAIGVLDTSFNSPNGSIIQPISSFIDYWKFSCNPTRWKNFTRWLLPRCKQ
jgi:hypothetical protein